MANLMDVMVPLNLRKIKMCIYSIKKLLGAIIHPVIEQHAFYHLVF